MPTIHAPNRDYTGITAGVAFAKGVGHTDDPAALAYLARAGYGIDAPAPAPAPDTRYSAEQPPATVHLGAPLRDAAVDPRPGDFLVPVNAGVADPHSPAVVAPEIHASPTGPIHPGEVGTDDPARQDAQETALAAAVRVDGQEVGQATNEAATATPSSAPASEATADVAPEPEAAASDLPGANAKKAEWVAYAEAHGIPRAEAEDLTIAKLRERLGA